MIALTAPSVQVFDADTASGLAQEANDVLVEAVRKYPSRFTGLGRRERREYSDYVPLS